MIKQTNQGINQTSPNLLLAIMHSYLTFLHSHLLFISYTIIPSTIFYLTFHSLLNFSLSLLNYSRRSNPFIVFWVCPPCHWPLRPNRTTTDLYTRSSVVQQEKFCNGLTYAIICRTIKSNNLKQ